MMPIGFGLVLAGYSLLYTGIWKLRGDQRSIVDILKGSSLTYGMGTHKRSTPSVPAPGNLAGAPGGSVNQTSPLNPGGAPGANVG